MYTYYINSVTLVSNQLIKIKRKPNKNFLPIGHSLILRVLFTLCNSRFYIIKSKFVRKKRITHFLDLFFLTLDSHGLLS